VKSERSEKSANPPGIADCGFGSSPGSLGFSFTGGGGGVGGDCGFVAGLSLTCDVEVKFSWKHNGIEYGNNIYIYSSMMVAYNM